MRGLLGRHLKGREQLAYCLAQFKPNSTEPRAEALEDREKHEGHEHSSTHKEPKQPQAKTIHHICLTSCIL